MLQIKQNRQNIRVKIYKTDRQNRTARPALTEQDRHIGQAERDRKNWINFRGALNFPSETISFMYINLLDPI
jgi:hypothetical protein